MSNIVIYFELAGLAFLLIHVFVMKHTFEFKTPEEQCKNGTITIGEILLFTIIYAIPILNIIAFLLCLASFCIAVSENEVKFRWHNRFLDAIIKILKYEV